MSQGLVPNHAQLNGIITEALDDTFGAPESPRRHRKREAVTNAWIDLIAAIQTIAKLDADLVDVAE